VFQIEQCFDVPYEDLFGMTRITMDRVWVVTSRRIVPGAADSVFSHLEKRNLSKLVRFISGENLVQLIDQHYMAYWDESLEPIEILKEQKNRLANFSRNLLLSMGASSSDVESTLMQVIQSSFPPAVSPSSDKSLSRVSPYRVELDSIDSLYSHDFHSHECGPIREMFFKAKQNIYYSMFDVDEIVEHYEQAIKKTDPRELVKSFWDHLAKEYPFWNSFGRASDAIRDIEYLEEGLKDIDRLRQKLAKVGKLDWATSLVDSVKEQEADIKKFLAGVDKATFRLGWRIETHDGLGKLVLAYEGGERDSDASFSTEHKRERETFGRYEKGTRAITVKDITDEVHYRIREYLDKMLVAARSVNIFIDNK
jgi:hypothetical protein